MPRGRPKKIKVTREEIEAIKVEKSKTSYERKKQIIPGPWTDKEVNFAVNASLKQSRIVVFNEPVWGSYQDDNSWSEKGWYPIVVNVQVANIEQLQKEHSLNDIMAAVEKSLNDNKKLGHIIPLSYTYNNNFFSVWAKTNKKNIIGFAATRQKVYQIISEKTQDEPDSNSGNEQK